MATNAGDPQQHQQPAHHRRSQEDDNSTSYLHTDRKRFKERVVGFGYDITGRFFTYFAPLCRVLSDDKCTKIRFEPLWLLAVASSETKRNALSSDGCMMVQCVGRVEASRVLQAPCSAPPLRACRQYELGCECPDLPRTKSPGSLRYDFQFEPSSPFLASVEKHVLVDSEEEKR